MIRTTAGQWNAYVEAGRTREQRAERLLEVPAALRPGVERHVYTCFARRRVARRR